MDVADKELVAEFVVESQEGLANVETQMLAIEASGANVDTDLVNSVFRTMHSIKGAAGFLGLDRIGSLAHSLEELLNNLRNREMIPTSELITTMLRAADYMKQLIDEVETSNDADVAPYVSELQQFRVGAQSAEEGGASSAAPATAAPEPTPTPVAPEGDSTTASPMSEAVREFLIECYENLDQMDRELVALEQDPSAEQLLRNVFRTIHTVKGGAGFLGLGELEKLTHAAEDLLGKLRSGERAFNATISSALLATVDKCREGLKMVEETGGTSALNPQPVIDQLRDLDKADGTPTAQEAASAPAPAPSSDVAPPVEAPAKPATATPVAPTSAPPVAAASSENAQGEKPTASASESTIRVDVDLLDKLMTRVGELVLARNQILQFTNSLDDSNFISTAQRLNLITTELQESVMKTRMQPIGNVWAKFPRVVRDLSTQLGKQVRIEMEGKETELDKTIIESIKDPLTHLVRNSVDHGVELPESRRAAGKPPEGCLTLRAYHEGGQVNIEISDDGAGLDVDRIRKKAVEKGLVSADQATRMSDREAAQMILLPGFSTAEQVTSVSGRGVGMDVVKTNIERIGGTLDLQSQPGEGTTVKIKIPLTLAIIPALVVTCGGDRYAIPQVSLLELVRLEGEQARKKIEQIQGAPVYRLRGQLLPLVYLSEVLASSPGNNNKDKAPNSTDAATDNVSNLDFKVAKAKHLAWKTRLRQFLNGGEALSFDEAVSYKACALGKWLYGEGLSTYGHVASLKELEQMHMKMHAAVGNVIQRQQQGDTRQAEAGVEEVDAMSQKVVALLDDLEHSVRGTRAINIVVLRAEDRQFGLVVDSINDTEEIVVKPLSKQLKGIPAYAGATIMGDGKVALILDVLGAAQKAHVVTEHRDRGLSELVSDTAQQGNKNQTMLLLAVGDRQVAMPISLVARLEEIPRSSIEQSDHQEVVQYRGQIMPLVRLSALLDIPTQEDTSQPMQVVVYSEGERSLGFVVDRVADIAEAEITVTHECNSGELLKSTVIQQRVTDLLNLPSIIRRVDPKFFASQEANQQLAV
jgi:two-component system chemotaxis sensor kinase CheA